MENNPVFMTALVVLGLFGVALCASLVWFVRRAGSANVDVVQAVDAATLDALAERIIAGTDARFSAQTHATVETVVTVAGDKFASQAQAMSEVLELRQAGWQEGLTLMRAELASTREAVTQLQREKAEQHAQLSAQLEATRVAQDSLSMTTQTLRELLSNSRARGQWGEAMAEDILRAAGMIEGVNYVRQSTTAEGRPDLTVRMPQGRELHVDVKFPLDNYARYIQAATDPERADAAKAFCRDVRARVKELADRGYADPGSSFDFVVAFIPNESIYAFVHEQDPGLFDEARSRKVVLCGPFSFVAVLAVVRQAADAFMMEQTGTEILERLGSFSVQWEKYSDEVDKLGKQFGTAQKTLDSLTGTRRRALQRELEAVDDLRGQGTREGARVEVAPEGLEVDECDDFDVEDVDLDETEEAVAAVGGGYAVPHAPRRLRPVRIR